MRTATSRTGVGDFRQVVQVGPHSLIADEPNDKGGDDAGPEPHEFLLVALSACTSMTLKLYADRKGWPLESVDVSVAGDQVDGVFVMTRTLAVHGNLSDEQRARLLEIANKCPVHRALTGTIRIETDLAR
jgi:putative redox protein